MCLSSIPYIVSCPSQGGTLNAVQRKQRKSLATDISVNLLL